MNIIFLSFLELLAIQRKKSDLSVIFCIVTNQSGEKNNRNEYYSSFCYVMLVPLVYSFFQHQHAKNKQTKTFLSLRFHLVSFSRNEMIELRIHCIRCSPLIFYRFFTDFFFPFFVKRQIIRKETEFYLTWGTSLVKTLNRSPSICLSNHHRQMNATATMRSCH